MSNHSISNFNLSSTSGKTFSLTQAKDFPLIVYFYPKDHTSGCTTESMQFRDYYPQFKKLGCEIVGVSRDSITSHEKFKEKLGLPFELLSDSEELACKLFGVIKMKNMYGKKVRGIERSTFILDKKGTIIHEWRGVKVPGHVEEVLKVVKTLK